MKKKETMHFNGERYQLHHGRWERSSRGHILLSHDVWNYHHPNDLITKGDGFVIHHINQKPNDDRIENLQKMIDFEHRSSHHRFKNLSGKNNPAWKGGISPNYRKTLFSINDKINHFSYGDYIQINKKTKSVCITHGWCYY